MQISQGKVREKSGNFDILCEWQPWTVSSSGKIKQILLELHALREIKAIVVSKQRKCKSSSRIICINHLRVKKNCSISVQESQNQKKD